MFERFERTVETARFLSTKLFGRMPASQRVRGVPSRFGFERLEDRRVLSAATLINEIDVNCPGRSDNRYMYVELEGTPGASLNNMYFVAFQSGGNAEFVQSLSGYSIGADGLAVIKNSTGGFSIPAATTLIPNNTFFTSRWRQRLSRKTRCRSICSPAPLPLSKGPITIRTTTACSITCRPAPRRWTTWPSSPTARATLTYGGVVIHNLDWRRSSRRRDPVLRQHHDDHRGLVRRRVGRHGQRGLDDRTT